jgi:putative transposase
MEVMPDHVHLLCQVDPQFGNLSVCQKYPGCRFAHVVKRILNVAFSNSYVIEVATVGGAVRLAVIKPYVKNQKDV